jgi:FKBP-type peptidyl-prolyl cis-trans isomerase
VNASQATPKRQRSSPTPLAELPEGRIVDGSFRVAATLARTDYADFYAVVAADGTRLALEVLAAPVVPGKAYKDRFAQSALSSARVTSRHVAAARAAGIDAATGAPWIVYDAFDETLAAAIARGPASPEHAVAWLRSVAEALEAAHATGTAHGALRPEAVVLVGGAVRVLNFGIAKVLSDARAATSPSTSPSDPRWAAPEQCSLTGSADRLSDVWSLGQLAVWLVHRQISPAFDAWLARCLDEDRAARWPTALIAVSELSRALDAERPGSMERTISIGPVAMHVQSAQSLSGAESAPGARKSTPWVAFGILGAIALVVSVGVAGVVGVRASEWSARQRNATQPSANSASAQTASIAPVSEGTSEQAAPAVDVAALPRSATNAPATTNTTNTTNTANTTKAAPATPALAPSKLAVVDLAPGRGRAAAPGDKLVVRYVGKRLDGGVTYDTLHKTAPFSFTLGKGAVTKGWEQGLIGMRAGAHRRLTVPPSLGYGERGLPPSVPPNATLVFDIELVSVE